MQPVVDAMTSTVDTSRRTPARTWRRFARRTPTCASRGYRNMRFLRFLFKKKAVGDSATCFSPGRLHRPGLRRLERPQRHAPSSAASAAPTRSEGAATPGPQRRAALRLGVQDVGPGQQHVDADVNMKAVWSRDRDRRMVQRKKSKIHKVMHCQTSAGRPATPPITTWNRDVNVSRNILMRC
jgi:hypothetical protein